ncbi:MAG: ABC transporter permease [Burkholderiales bacterium]|nr:ABC transporter permease [Burkholderiales bacterium]
MDAPRLTAGGALPWITTPLLLAILVLAWHLYVSETRISAFILPSPAAVWEAWKGIIVAASTWNHTWATVYETLAGFFWASLVGVSLGVALARLRWLEITLNPFIVATQVVPKVALVPLMIVWFGFGMTSKVVIAAVLAFFPILTNTVLGVKSVDSGHRDVMLSLNATRWMVFRRLELPSSLPYILTGMEVGVVLAIIGAVVGEFLGGNTGLGYLLVARMGAYETDVLFAVIVHMTMVGFLFYFAIGVVRRVLIPWHESVVIEKAAR